MDANKFRSPLEIPELLENVLLHLTQGDILQAQRTNHFWADVISESPLLQQKLFFQPLPPSKAAGRPVEFNTIVEALFPFLFQPYTFPGGWFITEDVEETIQHWAADPARRQAVMRPEASWRRMLPVQPAAPIDAFVMNENKFYDGVRDEDVYLIEWCEVDASKHASASAARSNLGGNATMGLLYDIIVPHLNATWDAGICVQWNMVELTHDICYKSWLRLGGPPEVFDKRPKPCKYAKVKPRNTITIHAEEGHWGNHFSQETIIVSPLGTVLESWGLDTPGPAYPIGLGVILDLPAGVVRTGNKANRYPAGSMDPEYLDYGRLAPGLESEHDIELREGEKNGL